MLLLPAIVVGLVVLGEVLVLLLLLPAFVLARVAFGKPWIVEVVAAGKVVHAEPVVGWRAAGARVQALAAEIGGDPWAADGSPSAGPDLSRATVGYSASIPSPPRP